MTIGSTTPYCKIESISWRLGSGPSSMSLGGSSSGRTYCILNVGGVDGSNSGCTAGSWVMVGSFQVPLGFVRFEQGGRLIVGLLYRSRTRLALGWWTAQSCVFHGEADLAFQCFLRHVPVAPQLDRAQLAGAHPVLDGGGLQSVQRCQVVRAEQRFAKQFTLGLVIGQRQLSVCVVFVHRPPLRTSPSGVHRSSVRSVRVQRLPAPRAVPVRVWQPAAQLRSAALRTGALLRPRCTGSAVGTSVCANSGGRSS